jgi:uncharacterized lipoprotein YddW (UPF0748 family)
LSRPSTLFALCCALGLSVSVSLSAHGQDRIPPDAISEPIATSPAAPVRRPRALWVLAEGSQRVLEHPDRLDELFVDVAALDITDLFVQVYRGGRAWFPSSRADSAPYERVFRTGAPGETPRDGLQHLLDRAEAAGVRVHAWVNVLSLSKNRDAPIVSELGRDVVLSDQRGRSLLDYPNFEAPAPEGDYYRMGTPGIYLDPAFPGVAEYLSETFDELLAQYPALAGLHFDYIRYPDVLPFSPGLRFGVGISLGHGAASRARFEEETGLVAPDGDSLGHGSRFDDWRREKLTELVAFVGNRARAARPGLEISAAVISYADRAYLSLFQDWRGWLEEGLIDVAVPMLYSKDPRLVRYGVEHFAGLPYAERIWVGLGSWLFADRPERALAQLSEVESRPPLGVALFSWDSIRQSDPLRTALARSAEPAPPPETAAHEFPAGSVSETAEPAIAPLEPERSEPSSQAEEEPEVSSLEPPAADPAPVEPPAADPAPLEPPAVP